MKSIKVNTPPNSRFEITFLYDLPKENYLTIAIRGEAESEESWLVHSFISFVLQQTRKGYQHIIFDFAGFTWKSNSLEQDMCQMLLWTAQIFFQEIMKIEVININDEIETTSMKT